MGIERADFDIAWRKNYELIACVGWLLAAIACYAGWKHGGLPDMPFQAGLVVSLIMMASWVPGVMRMAVTRRGLRRRKVGKINGRQLRARIESRKDSCWIGSGFEWGRDHSQRLYDFLREAKESDIRQQEDELGAYWIHGMSSREEALYQPLEHHDGHVLIPGTTGAGKTLLFRLLITQAVQRGEAVVVIDPKGDKGLRDTARKACEMVGHPERFMYFHPAFPEESIRIDPLHNFNRTSEPASRVAALIPSETGADPFKAFGQMALDEIAQGELMVGNRPTLKRFRQNIEGGIDDLLRTCFENHFRQVEQQWERRIISYLRGNRHAPLPELLNGYARFYKEEIRPDRPNQVLDGLISRYEHNREHFQKMVASLMPILSMLTSGELGDLLSPDPRDPYDTRPITDTARIINNGQVLYMGLDSLSDAIVGSAIGSMFLADLASVAGDRYNFGVDNRPVNVFIDEAAEVINDPFIQILNKGRGARLRCYIATQTFADFVARTGNEAKARQVLGNVNNIICLRIKDAETQEYVAEQAPKVRVRKVMIQQGTANHQGNPLVFTGSAAERLDEEEVEALPPALLGQLPNFEYFGLLSGGRIVKGRYPVVELDERAA